MTDYGIRRYRIGNALLRRSLLEGFSLEGNTLRTQGDGPHHVFLPALDSANADCPWGRVSLKCTLGPESMLTIRVFAADENMLLREEGFVSVDQILLDPVVSHKEKEQMFRLGDGLERSGVQDFLITGQNGRYLWLWLEVAGEGEAVIEDLRIYTPADHFFRTFPQVYQTDNDFLQRYLSIFSTMYQELQEKIDALPDLLDADTAPETLVPELASWLGLELDEALFTPDEQRRLLKAAPELMAWKGSKRAVEQAVSLFVPGKVYIVERNLLQQDERRSQDMYGKTAYDFSVMVNCKMEHRLRLQLQFLIDQFKPIRSHGRVIFLDERSGLDAYTYLDLNGTVLQNGPGNLDDGAELTGTIYLQ